MTAEEEAKLRTYLIRIGAISSEEELITRRHKSKAMLDQAQAYALGCSDALLQKEAMASTYDGIIRNLAEVLMAERTRARKGLVTETNPSVSETGRLTPAWLYLPVGPEGPRPWPDGT